MCMFVVVKMLIHNKHFIGQTVTRYKASSMLNFQVSGEAEEFVVILMDL